MSQQTVEEAREELEHLIWVYRVGGEKERAQAIDALEAAVRAEVLRECEAGGAGVMEVEPYEAATYQAVLDAFAAAIRAEALRGREAEAEAERLREAASILTEALMAVIDGPAYQSALGLDERRKVADEAVQAAVKLGALGEGTEP